MDDLEDDIMDEDFNGLVSERTEFLEPGHPELFDMDDERGELDDVEIPDWGDEPVEESLEELLDRLSD